MVTHAYPWTNVLREQTVQYPPGKMPSLAPPPVAQALFGKHGQSSSSLSQVVRLALLWSALLAAQCAIAVPTGTYFWSVRIHVRRHVLIRNQSVTLMSRNVHLHNVSVHQIWLIDLVHVFCLLNVIALPRRPRPRPLDGPARSQYPLVPYLCSMAHAV